MTVQENKDLIPRYVEEVYNAHNLEVYDEFVGDALQDSGANHTRQFFVAFPDGHCVVEDLIAEGDWNSRSTFARSASTALPTAKLSSHGPCRTAWVSWSNWTLFNRPLAK